LDFLYWFSFSFNH